VIAFAVVITIALWYSRAESDVYMLKLLSLILWGATIMVFIDHLASYLVEGGEFLEMSPNVLVLGFVMLLRALMLWELALIIKDPKGILHNKKD